ncbi:MAG: L-rhamnose mutarotase [Sphingobacteriaceae bacterium]|nr:MAG: L-rhamnose mutarotase [Sphingobacteriaceae bacterium]
MNRLAFEMNLYPNCAEEYKRRHDEIWSELSRLLKKAGIKDYVIFLDEETNILFATLKVTHVKDFNMLPALEIMQNWWVYMSDIMETNSDHSPISKNLTELFYLA